MNLIALLTFMMSFNVSACWESASQQISVQDDTLTIIQTANFCLGSGATCPQIDFYTYSINGNQICFDVFYNLTSVWPSFQCTRIDTIRIELPYAVYDVCLNSYNIVDVDTNWVETDFTYGIVLSLQDLELSKSVKISPNPTSGKVLITGTFEADEIIITDLMGRQIRKQVFVSELDLESLSGIFLIHVLTNGKAIACRRVAIEE